MKILSLKLQNLNSLEGEWSIDFTHPDFAGGGIFAITGPTGAGKTTILDAMTLALYGRTPRLGKITESANEIMSRRQGECAAELTFACARGRFRAHWSQRRARKKPGAKLQEPRHEIADDATGQLLETARSRTEQEVANLCGMSFGQFTRSILLAQGDFAAFLEAPPEEKASLLEQISGTEIYSRISMKVHERKNVEQEKLREAASELARRQALPQEDEEALKAASLMAQKEIARLDADMARLRELLNRREKEEALAKRALELEEERLLLQKKRADFQPQRERLAADRAAAFLGGPHSRLATLREKTREKALETEALSANLAPLEKSLSQASASFTAAHEAAEAAKAAEAEARPRLNEARELDLKIGQLSLRLKPLEAERTRLSSALELQKKNADQLQKKLDQAQKEDERFKAALKLSLMEEAEAREKSLASEILLALRADLRAGAPCPLCGATERPHDYVHPAAAPSSLSDLGAENIAGLFAAKKKQREEAEARLAAVSQSIRTFERDLTAARVSLPGTAEAAERLKSEGAELAAEQTRLLEKRRALLGADSPQAREAALTGAVKKAEASAARAAEIQQKAAHALTDLKSRLSAARQNLEGLAAESNAAEEFFQTQLAATEFTDETAYLAAALSPERRGELAAAEKKLSDALAINEAVIRENEAALKSILALRSAGEASDLAIPRENLAALSAERDQRQAALGALAQKIREHEEAAGLCQSLLARRDQQKKEYERWSRLHELIGSADGKKYRHFAQGLTFEALTVQANIWLNQMSDRYLLTRSGREALELAVIDNYQAGEIRSAKNLSGGERFIVSLALALGLSKMAGLNARVDSLFLDEGFGALDEDSLDAALEALARLREHGKLIGVISHIPALTNRIPAQIKVSRLPGGLASIHAPGK